MADDFETTCPNCGAPNDPEAMHCRVCGTPLHSQPPAPVAANAEAASQLGREITQITEPLMAAVASATQDLIGTSLARILQEAGPRQGEVMRRCAIPRWFDQGVLAVLRENEDGNERVLNLLRGYTFVRPVDEQRFTYHDEVRDAMLLEWRTQRSEEYREINRRLAAYFRERAARLMPSRSLPKSPAATTVSISPAGMWELYQREALYHTLMADAQQGLDELQREFTQAEAGHQLGEAEALLQLARSAPLTAGQQLRVQYMRARLEKASLQLPAAEQRLTVLLDAGPALDRPLEALALRTLGEIYAETARWVNATEIYTRARTIFESEQQEREAAETWRLLGEAYQELGLSTGGWHVPAYPQNAFFRWFGEAWTWLLALPFYFIVPFIKPLGVRLPRPIYLSSYHNWTLVWIYRSAASCYEHARQRFLKLGDDIGMLRTERQIADITRIFGYTNQALALIEQLHTRPAAQDPYRRAWLDWVEAAALVDMGKLERALPLIDQIIGRFREVGDLRREAAALALQARALADNNNFDQALQIYTETMDRFRNLNAVGVRELMLYDLRALRRRVGPGQRSLRIRTILLAQPEKRYVARFPRSQLPQLRMFSIIALPLALLLLAVFGPRDSVQQVAQLATLQTTIDPVRIALVLGVLLVLYLAAYALVAIGVLLFVPLGDLGQEQPDYYITDPEGISRYDSRGALALRLRWEEIQRWLRVERKLWKQPISLLSGAYLEDEAGEDMQIDGIVGWYRNLQEDIDSHLRSVDSRVHSRDYGFSLIGSRSGSTAIAGVLLLLLFIWSQNAWAEWLVALLPTPIYASLSLLAFSGLLILVPAVYWLVISPLELRRVLEIQDFYPYIVGIIGLGMIAIGALGLVPRVAALNYGMLLSGALSFGYALSVVVAANRRRLRLVITSLAVVLSVGYIASAALPDFDQLVAQAGADRAILSAGSSALESAQASIDAGQRVVSDPETSPQARAQAYANQGRAYYAVGEYRLAFEAYTAALELYNTLPQGELQQQAQAVVLYNRYKALRDGGGSGWSSDLQTACRLLSDVGPDCMNPPRE